MYLKEFNKEDIEKEFEFFKSIKTENGFENPYEYICFAEFENEVDKRIEVSKGINLDPGHVPDTYLFLWDSDEIVGLYKVRHYLNNFLKEGAGHIGYCIAPKYRKKGYAKSGLKLAVEALRNMKDFDGPEVYMSCNKDNIASLKTQLACGAYIHHEDKDHYFTRIK